MRAVTLRHPGGGRKKRDDRDGVAFEARISFVEGHPSSSNPGRFSWRETLDRGYPRCTV